MPVSADLLSTFVEVVRQQSLSGAGRRLGLPKSTVSRRLARLEQELGIQLVLRDGRSVSLTSTGRDLYTAVAGPVDALDAALADLTEDTGAPRGNVRVTAPTDLGRMLLPPMFVAFMERYPEITLDLWFTNRVVDLASEGVDLAVRAGRTTHPDLIARKLCDAELQLATAPGFAQRIDSDPRALEQQPFVLHRASRGTQPLRLERAGARRRESMELTVSGRVSVDDYASLAEFVAAGQGIGLLPAMHVKDGVKCGTLLRLFPEWSSRAAHIYLVTASRKQPQRVTLLADFLRDAFTRIEKL